MLKNIVPRIFFWVMVAVVLIYLAASIIPAIFSSEEITVEQASPINYEDALNVSGIVLRNEVLLTSPENPAAIDYKIADGERVSIGDPVATYSTRETPASDRLAIEAIDRQITLLNSCVTSTTQYDLKTLDAKTKDTIREYLSVSENGDLSDTLNASDDVISNFVKRDIKASGDKSYYKQILSNCESTRSAILRGNGVTQNAVYASQAGYFSSQFDGYETLKSTDYAKATPDTLRELLAVTPATRPSDYVGKLQHFSYWTYLCNIPFDDSEQFSVGETRTLRFETAAYGPQTVSMKITHISESVNGEVTVAFESSFFNRALYSMRINNAQILLKSYSGFKIDKDAIRVSEGKTGVYVLSGAKLVFKPVSVLFRSDERDFAVVAPASDTPSRTLILNDAVVVGGKEVYDGKVVNIH